MFGHLSKQVKRTRKWIFDALLSLIGEKPYDEIKVADIAEEAGVARQSFYRNFTNKDDVLYKYNQLLFDEFLSKIKEIYKRNETKAEEIYTEFFKTLYEHRSDLFRLNEASLSFMFYASPWQLAGEPEFRNIKSDFNFRYQLGGIVAVAASWIEHKMDKTPEEMGKISAELTSDKSHVLLQKLIDEKEQVQDDE